MIVASNWCVYGGGLLSFSTAIVLPQIVSASSALVAFLLLFVQNPEVFVILQFCLFESLNSVEPSRIWYNLNPSFYSFSTKRESSLDLETCGTTMKFEERHGCACLLKRGAGVKVEVKEETVICEVNPAPALKLDPFSTLALCQSSVWKQMDPRRSSRQGTVFGSVNVTITFLSQVITYTLLITVINS